MLFRMIDNWIYQYAVDEFNQDKGIVQILSRNEIQARIENEQETERLLESNPNQKNNLFPRYPRISMIQCIWNLSWNIPQIILLVSFLVWISDTTLPSGFNMISFTYSFIVLYLTALIIWTVLYILLKYSQILNQSQQLNGKVSFLYFFLYTISGVALVFIGIFFLFALSNQKVYMNSDRINSHSKITSSDFFSRLIPFLLIHCGKTCFRIVSCYFLPHFTRIVNFLGQRPAFPPIDSKVGNYLKLPSTIFTTTTTTTKETNTISIEIIFQFKSNRVKGISFHPRFSWIAVCNYSGMIEIWDYQTKLKEYEFQIGSIPIRSISFHSNLPLLASGGDDDCIRIWNYQEKKIEIEFSSMHTDYIRCVKFHPHYDWLLISGSDDMTIRLWNIIEKQCISVLKEHKHYVMSVCFHPIDDLIVSASLDRTIRIWDFHGLVVQRHQQQQQQQQQEQLLPGTNDNADVVRVRSILEGHERGVNYVSFHPADPLILLSASDDKTIKLWKQVGIEPIWKMMKTFQGHSHNVMSVLALPSPSLKHLIVSVSEDTTLRVWDSREGDQVYRMELAGVHGWMVEGKDDLCAVAHDNGLILLNFQNTSSQSV